MSLNPEPTIKRASSFYLSSPTKNHQPITPVPTTNMVSHIPIPSFLLPFFILGLKTHKPCENPHCRAIPHEEVIAIMRAMSTWAGITRDELRASFDSEIEEQEEELEWQADESSREINRLKKKIRDRENAFVALWFGPNPEGDELVDRVLFELGL